jgi:endogenous inhibitor of DNA gyrase (YacG/DUF329 family)
MTTVMILCPTTGKPVPVGEQTPKFWRANPAAFGIVHCPLCGALHEWQKKDAWLEGSPADDSE